jgi:hypothetical protein
MLLSKKRYEIIVILLIILSSIYLFVTNRTEKKQLNKNGVYILGKLDSSYFVGETGWMYKYRYTFNKKIFYKSFSGPLPPETKNDSLMFFIILPNKPEVCRQIADIRVPKCLTLYDNPKNGWGSLPLSFCK